MFYEYIWIFICIKIYVNITLWTHSYLHWYLNIRWTIGCCITGGLMWTINFLTVAFLLIFEHFFCEYDSLLSSVTFHHHDWKNQPKKECATGVTLIIIERTNYQHHHHRHHDWSQKECATWLTCDNYSWWRIYSLHATIQTLQIYLLPPPSLSS